MGTHLFYIRDYRGSHVATAASVLAAARALEGLSAGATVTHVRAPGEPIYFEDGSSKASAFRESLIVSGYERFYLQRIDDESDDTTAPSRLD